QSTRSLLLRRVVLVVVQEFSERALEWGRLLVVLDATRRLEQGALQLGRDRVPVQDHCRPDAAQDVLLLTVRPITVAALQARRIAYLGTHRFARVCGE